MQQDYELFASYCSLLVPEQAKRKMLEICLRYAEKEHKCKKWQK